MLGLRTWYLFKRAAFIFVSYVRSSSACQPMPRLVKDRCVLGKDNRLAKILAVEFVVDLFCEPRSQFFKVYYFWVIASGRLLALLSIEGQKAQSLFHQCETYPSSSKLQTLYKTTNRLCHLIDRFPQ